MSKNLFYKESKNSLIKTNNLLYQKCFYSTRVAQSLRVLIPHNVSEPFQINNEKETGLSCKEPSSSG